MSVNILTGSYLPIPKEQQPVTAKSGSDTITKRTEDAAKKALDTATTFL